MSLGGRKKYHQDSIIHLINHPFLEEQKLIKNLMIQFLLIPPIQIVVFVLILPSRKKDIKKVKKVLNDLSLDSHSKLKRLKVNIK